METLTSNEIGKHEKIKTHFARIVVGGTAEKPCYGILYFDPSDGKYHQGFGSYVLEYVFNWLAEEFEITGDAFSNEPVRHREWLNVDVNWQRGYSIAECSECGEKIEIYKAIDTIKFCPNCGAKMDGGVTDD